MRFHLHTCNVFLNMVYLKWLISPIKERGMKQKKAISVLWLLLAATLFVLVALSGYRWVFSLSSYLKKDVHITRMEVWRPFAQIDNVPEKLEITEEAEQQIIGLVTAPTYHRELFYDDFGGDTFFMIYLKGQNNMGEVQQYSYSISNKGEVRIRDLSTGEELQYVTSDGNPFIVNRQKTREFYDKIAELSGYSG